MPQWKHTMLQEHYTIVANLPHSPLQLQEIIPLLLSIVYIQALNAAEKNWG